MTHGIETTRNPVHFVDNHVDSILHYSSVEFPVSWCSVFNVPVSVSHREAPVVGQAVSASDRVKVQVKSTVSNGDSVSLASPSIVLSSNVSFNNKQQQLYSIFIYIIYKSACSRY